MMIIRNNLFKESLLQSFYRYTCGPYAQFKTEDDPPIYYEKFKISCQWNKTWTADELDPCQCKLITECEACMD